MSTLPQTHSGSAALPEKRGLELSPPKEIATRSRLSRTNLGDGQELLRVDVKPDLGLVRPSIVTRRQAWKRRRRRKRVLIGIALIFALFPPVWAVYFVGWLIWRQRPQQQSMRKVRKAIGALEKNQTGPALKQLQEAHLLDPSNSDALYWLGLVLNRQNRQEEAEEALSLVAERVPGLPEVESALVDAYVSLNDSDAAIYHAQRLFEVAPHAPESLLKLADAFEAAGKPELAIQSLEQAPIHKRNPTSDLLKVHYRLGTLYERTGDRQRALQHYNRVYARDISYKDVQSRVKALEGETS